MGWTMPDSFPDLSSAKKICVDCETRDPDLKRKGPGVRRGACIVGVAIGTDDGFRAYYPVAHDEGPNMNREAVLSWLREELSRENQEKVGANILYDADFLSHVGVELAGPWRDVQVAEPLLDENALSYSLSSLAKRYLGEDKLEDEIDQYAAGKGWKGKAQMHLWRMPPSVVGPYAIADVDLPLRILELQERSLREQDLVDLFKLESKLTKVLLRMRRTGVRIDVGRLEETIDQFKKRLFDLKKSLKRDAGFDVEVWAAASVARAFDAKGLAYPLTAKTKQPSFTRTFLERHDHPMARSIVEVRSLEKFIGTFLKGSIRDMLVGDRIHGQFHQLKGDDYGAVTGRLSSSNPNLQFIPARDEELGPLCRSLFVPEVGHVWGKADLSQIEFRLFAHYASGDGAEEIRRRYNEDPDIDFHQICADLAGVDRKRAKCFHPDTEVLTRSGWKQILSLEEGDSICQAIPCNGWIQLEWTNEYTVEEKPNHEDHLVWLRNEGVDLRLTPDHRCLVHDRLVRNYRVVSPCQMGTSGYSWSNAGTLINDCDWDVPEKWLRLAVATQADGSYGKIGTARDIRFGFTKTNKIERMDRLLHGISHRRVERPINGVTGTFFYIDPSVTGNIRKILDPDKTLSWRMLTLPLSGRTIVLDEARWWDSHQQNNWQMYMYGSVLQKNVDVLQAIAAITGRKTRKTQNKNGFHLSIKQRKMTRGGNVIPNNIPYTKNIAMISVPSTFLLVRDGGIPVITGQTINFGKIYGMGLDKLCSSMGMSREEGQRFMEAYDDAIPFVKHMLRLADSTAQKRGYVRTILGRRRRFDAYEPADFTLSKKLPAASKEDMVRTVNSEIRKDPTIRPGVRRARTYKALNAVIQGSAADQIKKAMVDCDEAGLWDVLPLHLTVHDELDVSVPKTQAGEEAFREMVHLMEEAVPLRVPVRADWKTGRNWGEC